MKIKPFTNLRNLFTRTTAVTLITLLLLAALPVSAASAATTLSTFPGTGANVTGTGTIAWGTPGNITADDTNYATATLTAGQVSNYLQATNYGFAIPSTATISGISVTIGRMRSSGNGSNVHDTVVQLLKGGTLTGSNLANTTAGTWPSSTTGIADASYGGTSNLWGTTWTPEDINASNFGVALAATSVSDTRTLSVDYMRITVTYTVPSAATGSPTSGANVTGVGTLVWTNPGNVVSDNNSYATAGAATGQTNYLEATGYGFAIPTDATISGITVVIRRLGTTGGGNDVRDAVVSLIKAGTVTGDNKADTGTDWTTTETPITYGNDGDLWGTSWTPAQINASNFGVALSASLNGKQASVDFIQVTVSYSTPAPTTLTVASATGTYNGTVALSATLTKTSGSVPVSGKTIAFTLNGTSVGSASTNSSGVATLSSVSLSGINVGSYPTGVGASFVGDSNYVASSGSNSLTVNKANQTITVGTHAPASAAYNSQFTVAHCFLRPGCELLFFWRLYQRRP